MSVNSRSAFRALVLTFVLCLCYGDWLKKSSLFRLSFPKLYLSLSSPVDNVSKYNNKGNHTTKIIEMS